MTQTSNRFYDRFAQLMNDAANVAQGVRKEASTMFRSQAERMANDIDLVKREDFDAVREMAKKARDENSKLEERIAVLEGKLGISPPAKAAPKTGARARSAAGKTRTTKVTSSAGRSSRVSAGRAKPATKTTATKTTGTKASSGRSSGRARSGSTKSPQPGDS